MNQTSFLEKTYNISPSCGVCTLFEGDYHLGLAVLVNSLSAAGFSGNVYAGYRGSLPAWAQPEMRVTDRIRLVFIELGTGRHLTNYKPDFMLSLLQERCPEVETLFYFDPDIVVRGPWSFFEAWAVAGVALCEDVNSPVHSTHPLRAAWRQYYGPHGFKDERALDVYVNGGFIGVSRSHRSFLNCWKHLQDLMEPAVGGLHLWGVKDRTFAFNRTDQDALNAAAMFAAEPISIVGKDGMDIIPGGYLMSHALGSPKPWNKSYLREAFRGFGPNAADKAFWDHTQNPIALFPPSVAKTMHRRMAMASLINRFFSR